MSLVKQLQNNCKNVVINGQHKVAKNRTKVLQKIHTLNTVSLFLS